MMEFREISFGSDEYLLELALREGVLRKPLGLSLSNEDRGNERGQLHFGLFAPNGDLLACVVAVPCCSDGAKIRQMAVSTSHQRSGLGRKLMAGLEENLRGRGFRRLVLNARASAVGFYEKLGYAGMGETFLEVGLPHLKMGKTI
ncbi:Acetyltransferase [Pontiella desulfatans]|uniref:Acetyltransferase n=2 Tax=Pontiella desulfatans TaxID=2750659 RepID=A0A6C2U637_PONDE|nr:Acetyltransferase [Pontiella desulfatans]